MFKRIVIELTGPICRCEEQSLLWSTPRDAKGKSILEVECKTCGTRLVVGNDAFVASYALEQPYPGKKPTPKPKPALKGLEGGKVIDIHGGDGEATP